jgi:hypothetical protein
MSGPGAVAGDQLHALVERIEHVEEEIRTSHRCASMWRTPARWRLVPWSRDDERPVSYAWRPEHRTANT